MCLARCALFLLAKKFDPQLFSFSLPSQVAEVAPLHGMGKPLVIRLPLAMYAEYSDTCQGLMQFLCLLPFFR